MKPTRLPFALAVMAVMAVMAVLLAAPLATAYASVVWNWSFSDSTVSASGRAA